MLDHPKSEHVWISSPYCMQICGVFLTGIFIDFKVEVRFKSSGWDGGVRFRRCRKKLIPRISRAIKNYDLLCEVVYA